jgi:siroheme synthase
MTGDCRPSGLVTSHGRPTPLVSFVGAGPGDADLITVKGLSRLRDADVVIHDRLIPLALLDQVSPGIETIDVGKVPGRCCPSQERINALIVDRAKTRGRVVRLKGGDPSVFGRLGEEIAAVRAAGLPFEVVPGVTAATAAAALAGISRTQRANTLTHRASSSTRWRNTPAQPPSTSTQRASAAMPAAAAMIVLATGVDHTGRQTAALDWDLLAGADATLVFYMAVRGLEVITAALTERGRDRGEPAVVAERVGTVHERVVAGRLGDIAAVAQAAGVESPAVLITGPTVEAALELALGQPAVSPCAVAQLAAPRVRSVTAQTPSWGVTISCGRTCRSNSSALR